MFYQNSLSFCVGVNDPATNESLILIELTDHLALSGAQMTRTSN